MYLMYVDECGDKGMQNESSRYFILSAIVMHESAWTDTLRDIADSKKDAFSSHGIDPSLEIHAKDMLGRTSKAYSSSPKLGRLMCLRDIMKRESLLSSSVRCINVVIDKQGKSFGYSPFEHAWDALINRFENTIEHGNFPIAKTGGSPSGAEHGLLIVDETDKNQLRDIIRRMRSGKQVPSIAGGTYLHRIKWVIEDAMHKRSEDSLPIQLCDMNAYFLKQMLEPNSTIKKHRARGYFKIIEPILLKEACRKDPLGIVRL